MKNLVVFFCCLFWAKFAISQSAEIYLSGAVDPSIVKTLASPEIFIRIHDDNNSVMYNDTILNIQLTVDGKFETRIKTLRKFMYFSFSARKMPLADTDVNEYVQLPNRGQINEFYLFQQGDSISMSVRDDGSLFFMGKRSAKLNCQFNLYSLANESSKIVQSRIRNVYNRFDFSTAFALESSKLEIETKLALAILNSFRTEIGAELYKILYVDAVSFREPKRLKMLRGLSPQYFSVEAVSKSKTELQKFLEQYKFRNYLRDFDPNDLSKSIWYVQYLFSLERAIQRSMSVNSVDGDSFEAVYTSIKQNYSGKLRDKLILLCFKELNEAFSSEIQSFLNDGINTVADSTYKKALAALSIKRLNAYPFELQDVNGKVHKLSDYQGKVLVFDFWFTGCPECIFLNEGMHPIIEKYKMNGDVVFFTISQDKQNVMWKNSVATKKYTSDRTINLYTNGLGRQHPIFKYYDIVGCPRQLIIDRNGKVVTVSPPRPDKGENEKITFMKLLDDTLTK